MMPTLLVVENPNKWRLDIDGVSVVGAKDYLTDPGYADLKRAKVFNLCENYAYQSLGYYVSLLAAARGHKPMPSATTFQDLRSSPILRVVSEDLQHLIDGALSSLKAARFELSIYWGRNLAKCYDRLAQALFNHFPAPLLRAEFGRAAPAESNGGNRAGWRLKKVRLIAWQDIPESHEDFVVSQAQRFFDRPTLAGKTRPRYDVAILVNPDEKDAPSDEKALRKFERAAKSLGARCSFITRTDYGRVGEFDALFIRETTRVNHHTYRFAQRAVAEGVVVIDDPESIIRCTNKVYLAELFRRHGIASPRSRIVSRANTAGLVADLGLPLVLKQPDSSFSQGVVKAETEAELKDQLRHLFSTSDLIVAQEYIPSEFDWRIGVLDGRALFACRYFMAKGHWQIQVSDGEKRSYGKHETVPIEEVPQAGLELALAACRLVGDGFYGVDLKQAGDKYFVIEINDNPSVEGGVEDAVIKDELYRSVMKTLIDRVEQRAAALAPG